MPTSETKRFETIPFFPDHDINVNITCLSLNSFVVGLLIDLNNFPKLETFYGTSGEMTVDHDHPSLKNVYLKWMTFSTLPINLTKLVAKNCKIRMNEDHPKLASLTVLVLENTKVPADYSSLLKVLWNEIWRPFRILMKMQQIWMEMSP